MNWIFTFSESAARESSTGDKLPVWLHEGEKYVCNVIFPADEEKYFTNMYEDTQEAFRYWYPDDEYPASDNDGSGRPYVVEHVLNNLATNGEG